MLGAAAGLAAGLCTDGGRRNLGFGSLAACAGPAAVPSGKFEIEKPETHRRRQYEYMELPNGLKVILASDGTCDKAAASLAVGVGKLHEPKDMPGLAHFCEHMLFLGTEAFPDEAEYKRFLKGHGGHCNAATGDDRTVYMFDVAPDHLTGVLDRFSNFFLSPLFTPSAVERELNAVDSEHSMRLTEDGRRSYASLLMDANPAHPLHWGSGNAKTLRDDPRARGTDPHKEAVAFYNKHYTAEDMTLAVLGREPLPELRRIVEERFAGVRRTGHRAARGDEHGGDAPAILPEDFRGLVLRTPSKDMRMVSFAWQLPRFQPPLWESKPTSYASFFVGHEGEGSLLSALKAAGYATALSAGCDDFGCFSHFDVTVTLTDRGLDNVEAVGDMVFTFLRLLRATPFQHWAVDELQGLGEVKFRFADDRQPYDLVSALAKGLQVRPAQHVLSAPYKCPSPSQAAFEEVVQLLEPGDVRVELVAKRFADKCQDKDPWYEGQFARLPLDATWTGSWARAAGSGTRLAAAGAEHRAAERAAAAYGMKLARPNLFLPKDLSLRDRAGATAAAAVGPSELSAPPPGIEKVFHRQDDRFLQPKAVAAFRFLSAAATADAESHLRSQLWCSAIVEELNEYSYDASVAGLGFHLSSVPSGMELSVGGFSDKLPMLLDIVAKKMREANSISEETFRIVQDRYQRRLKNLALKQRPCDFAARKARELQFSLAFPVEDRLAALPRVSYADLDGEGGRLLDNCHVEALLAGNLDAGEARTFAAAVSDATRPAPAEALPVRAEVQLPPGKTLWRLDGTNKEERNNCVRLEIQLPASMESYVYTMLFTRILGPKFFESLRTKQQLGYIVGMSPHESNNFIGVTCYAQTEFPPEYVRARFDEFLDDHVAWLDENLDEAEFKRQCSGIISNLSEAPKNLHQEFDRYWHEIALQRYAFDRREVKRAAVEAADLGKLRKFAREQLAIAPRLYVEVHNTSEQPGKQGRDGQRAAAELDRTWQSEEALHFRASAQWFSKGKLVETPQVVRQRATSRL